MKNEPKISYNQENAKRTTGTVSVKSLDKNKTLQLCDRDISTSLEAMHAVQKKVLKWKT